MKDEEVKSRNDVLFECIMSSLKEQEEITAKLYAKIDFVLEPSNYKSKEDKTLPVQASDEANIIITLSAIKNRIQDHNDNLLDIINRCVL